MIQGLVDHGWQSCCFGGVVCAFSWMTRGNAAVVRLWLWRIAALKLVLPFSGLVALGRWLGYPVAHSSEPVPPVLVDAIEACAPYVAPAAHFGISGILAAVSAMAGLAAAGALGCLVVRRLRVERARADEE